MRGRVAAVFCATHGRLPDLFGPVEEQLAAFVAILAGAALENAEGFAAARRVEAERGAAAYARSLLEASPDPLLLIDGEGRVTDLNRAAERVTGVPRESLLGSDVATYFTEPERIRAGHDEVFSRGVARDIGLSVRHASGARTDVLYSATLYRNAAGETKGVFASIRDVTRQRDDERRLREVAAMQRAILDGAYCAIFSTDASGKIRSYNAAAERLLGYASSEIVGRATPLLFHDPGEVRSRAAELSRELGLPVEPGLDALLLVARERGAEDGEWTFVRRDRRRIPVQLAVTALVDGAGAVTGFVGVANDITGRKEVDRLKDQFVSAVSHELRTPLTSIRGALGLLAGGATGELPAAADEIVRIAHASCERLMRLSNDILDLERWGSGSLELSLAELSSEEALAEAARIMQGAAESARVSILLPEGGAVLAPVRADRERIVQALVNLLSNAIKFSPAGGRARLAADECGAFVRFRIEDEGPGIPEAERHKRFTRFQQLDGSDARKQGGTGVGLAITRAIVLQHGGEVGVGPREGGGACFWFTLPRSPSPPSVVPTLRSHQALRARAARSIPVSRGRPQVLVVDADAQARAVVTAQLGALPADCAEAADASSALELARSGAVDLVVLELAVSPLPGRRPERHGGLELARRLRDADVVAPLLVYTARDVTREEARALERIALGGASHLTRTRDRAGIRR